MKDNYSDEEVIKAEKIICLEEEVVFRNPIVSIISHKKVPTLTSYETKKEKARAIITTSRGTVYMTEMQDCLILPGGTKEEGETSRNTIEREIKEELGISVSLTPFVCIEYYHEDFLKYQEATREKRCNKVYYYYGSADYLGEEHITSYEKKHQFQRKEYTLEEIYQKMLKTSDNPYKKFTDRELFLVLEYAKEKGII